jgi:tetratricopeptide (TPR) repeat protein
MNLDALQTKTSPSRLHDALADLERRVRCGESAAVEAVFESHGDLRDEADAALELIYTEFVLRQQLGQKPSPSDWYARFPRWRDDLAQLFEVHDFVAGENPANLTVFRGLTSRDTPGGRSPADPFHDTANGRRFGGYELIEEIGRGGMGVVYKARQIALNRTVALKLILSGRAASTAELERFRTEAESAARLSHPNIVRIFDVGVAEGRPYLSLEYVDGASLQKKLAAGPLPFREAAELTRTLALAVHDAHQQGVIHRDLKPDNVLLMANGVPKIADFGLARQEGDAPAGQTRSGAVLGTPAYMSPEQAAGDRAAIGPATDIYSLGAMLYEMLTGRPPFHAANVIDVLSAIRNDEPLAPHRLTARLPRDLDTICLKCLAKEPAGRYASADALAADLQRFIDGEPILARRIGVAGQTWRWCRRKPLVATLLAALLVACAAGMAGVTWQWRRAEKIAIAAQFDRDEAHRQRGEAVRERNRAVAEQDRAEAHYVRARQVLDQLTQLGVEMSNRQGMAETSRNILQQALTFYEGFLQERSDDPAVQLDTGRACQRAALINQQLGRMDAAEPILRRGVKILDELIEQEPLNAGARKALADCLVNLAFVLRHRGDPRASLTTYERTVGVLEELHRAYPDRRDYAVGLGNSLVNQSVVFRMLNRADDALKTLRRAIEIEEPLLQADPAHRVLKVELSLALDDYGAMLWERGKHVDGERFCRRAFDLRKTLVRGDVRNASVAWTQQVATDPTPIHLLARSHNRLARILATQKKAAEAEDHYKRALECAAQIVSRWPKTLGYARDALAYGHDLVRFHNAQGNRSAAESAFKQLLAIENLTTRAHPTDAAMHHAAAQNLLLAPFFKLHDPTRALGLARRAATLAPNNPEYHATVALAHLRLFDTRSALRELLTSIRLRLGWNRWMSVPFAASPGTK